MNCHYAPAEATAPDWTRLPADLWARILQPHAGVSAQSVRGVCRGFLAAFDASTESIRVPKGVSLDWSAMRIAARRSCFPALESLHLHAIDDDALDACRALSAALLHVTQLRALHLTGVHLHHFSMAAKHGLAEALRAAAHRGSRASLWLHGNCMGLKDAQLLMSAMQPAGAAVHPCLQASDGPVACIPIVRCTIHPTCDQVMTDDTHACICARAELLVGPAMPCHAT